MQHQDWDTIYVQANKQLNKNKTSKKEKTKDQKMNEQVEEGNFSFKMMDTSYGRYIQQCRCSKGWSQKELAQKLSISVKEITDIENGKAKHNGRLMSRLNNIFPKDSTKVKKKNEKKK